MPEASLHIVKNTVGETDQRVAIKLQNLSTDEFSTSTIYFKGSNDNSGAGEITLNNDSYATSGLAGTFGLSSYTPNGLFLSSNDSDIKFIAGEDITPDFERMTIKSNGNIGIGTIEPTEKLTVTGTIETTEGGIKFPDGTIQETAALDYSSLWDKNTIGLDLDGKFGLTSLTPNGMFLRSLNDISFYAGSAFSEAQTMTIVSSGDVGIGTSNPTEKLTVAGTIETTEGGIKFPDGTVQQTAATVTPTYWNKNTVGLDYDGNIGIGTTEPAAKLEVSDGDIYLNDVTSGVIMTSPNGTCFKMTVSDEGTPLFTGVTCP